MSAIEQLPPDQQAVLSLLVRQGRTYAQVAGLLGIGDAAVASRAHQAIVGIVGDAPGSVDPGDAGRITDYLLGQLGDAERIEMLDLLFDSGPARAWAREIAAELSPFARVALPTVPEDPEPRAPSRRSEPSEPGGSSEPAASPAVRERQPRQPRPKQPRPEREPRQPRPAREPKQPKAKRPRPERDRDGAAERPRRQADRGGGVLLIAAIIAVAALVIFVTDSGGSSTAAPGPIPASAATSTGTTTTSTTPDVTATVTMTPTKAGGSASGAVEVVKDGSSLELAFSAAHLPAPGSGHYVLWLYNSSTKYEALGEVQSVKANGSVGPLAVTLPANASGYDGVALTLDASGSSSNPGTVVLEGTSSSGF